MLEIAEVLYNWCLYTLKFYRTEVYWQIVLKFLFAMNLCNQPVAHLEVKCMSWTCMLNGKQTKAPQENIACIA